MLARSCSLAGILLILHTYVQILGIEFFQLLSCPQNIHLQILVIVRISFLLYDMGVQLVIHGNKNLAGLKLKFLVTGVTSRCRSPVNFKDG